MASAENISSSSSERTFGQRGRQNGQFSNPQDVEFVCSNKLSLFVSDTINQNVQLFSCETGQCERTFPSMKSRSTILRRPIGLSKIFDENLTLFVTDYDQHNVTSWNFDEENRPKLVKKICQNSLLGPKGIIVSEKSQRIVVADNKANRICVFNFEGDLIDRFGNRANEHHQLAGPHYLRFSDPNDERLLFVTDFYNNTVKLFDLQRQGQLVSSFGQWGTNDGCFQAPTGLAIDHQRGYVFVSDWGNNRVQIFDRQGNFIRTVQTEKSQSIYGPQGLDFLEQQRTLAIANSGKHCALLLRID